MSAILSQPQCVKYTCMWNEYDVALIESELQQLVIFDIKCKYLCLFPQKQKVNTDNEIFKWSHWLIDYY